MQVSTLSVGYDHIDVAAATRAGIAVGYTPGYLDGTTAELTLALMMASARRVVETSNCVASVRTSCGVRSASSSPWLGCLLRGIGGHGLRCSIVARICEVPPLGWWAWAQSVRRLRGC